MNQAIATEQVMAQRAAAAFDAMSEVLAVIHRRRHDLAGVPAGAALVSRADRIRPMYPQSDVATDAKAQTA